MNYLQRNISIIINQKGALDNQITSSCHNYLLGFVDAIFV